LIVFKKGEIIYNSHALKTGVAPRISNYPVTSWEPKKGAPIFPSTQWEFDFPEDEYLMGRDNFHDMAEDMDLYADLDEATRSDGRRDYGDQLFQDGEDGHSFSIT